PERRPAQARGAGAGAGDEAAAPADGRAVRLARRDRARPRGERPRRAGRAREHQRSAGDPGSRGGAHPLRRSLSAVAGAAGAHHPALPGADSAAARSRPFAHASRLRTALRAAVGGPLARGGSSGGGGMMRLEPRYAWVRQLAAFAVLLAVWEAAGRADMLNPLYAPSPSRVGAALIDLSSDGRIWPHLEATFSAALGGLALGIVVGIMLGVVAALVPFIAELLEPVMTVLNAIPRVILAPLFVIWLGIGLASKVALSFILVAVLIFFTVFTGIRQGDRRLVGRVITLGGDRWALVRHVYLPSVASWVLGNLKDRGRLCLHRRLRGRVRGRDRGPRLSPLLCAEHLQRRADVCADSADPGGGAGDFRPRGAAREASAALELSTAEVRSARSEALCLFSSLSPRALGSDASPRWKFMAVRLHTDTSNTQQSETMQAISNGSQPREEMGRTLITCLNSSSHLDFVVNHRHRT